MNGSLPFPGNLPFPAWPSPFAFSFKICKHSNYIITAFYHGYVVLNGWTTCFIDDESLRNNLKYNI